MAPVSLIFFRVPVSSWAPAWLTAKVAGLVAYYPFCYDNVNPLVPTLVLIGEKDDHVIGRPGM